MTLNMDEYQRLSAEVSTHPLNAPHQCIEYTALALCGEAGELANLVKKGWRSRDHLTHGEVSRGEARDALIEEAGDVLWYLARLSSHLGLRLSDLAYSNLLKLELRRNSNG